MSSGLSEWNWITVAADTGAQKRTDISSLYLGMTMFLKYLFRTRVMMTTYSCILLPLARCTEGQVKKRFTLHWLGYVYRHVVGGVQQRICASLRLYIFTLWVTQQNIHCVRMLSSGGVQLDTCPREAWGLSLVLFGESVELWGMRKH